MGFVADAQSHTNGIARGLQRDHLSVRNNTGALICGDARVAMDERFDGDDSRRRHVESGDTSDKRFTNAHLDGSDDAQVCNAIFFPAPLEGDELLLLMRVGCDHEFPCVTEGDLVLLAKLIGETVALDAMPRLQRIFRVVDARMIHSAIACAGGHAEFRKLLDQEYVLPAKGNSLG